MKFLKIGLKFIFDDCRWGPLGYGIFGGPLRIGLPYLPFVPPLYVVGNHTYVIPNKATDIADKLTDMQIEIDLLKERMKKMEKEMKEMNYLLQQWRSSQTGSTNF